MMQKGNTAPGTVFQQSSAGAGTSALVHKVRAFNRFYMPFMHLLGNHYLGSEYSVTEARIFFEIYRQEGCTAAHIAQTMQIDKSYLSRIISRHEKDGYIRRVRKEDDGRSYGLYLTETGRNRAENFISSSDAEIGSLLSPLSPEESAELEKAMDTVTKLLEKAQQS
ncbi:MAG: MarR family winged helix-turn-helix transcriptional regulator [Pyramidobacter sp.]